jgi:hypothetical protein
MPAMWDGPRDDERPFDGAACGLEQEGRDCAAIEKTAPFGIDRISPIEVMGREVHPCGRRVVIRPTQIRLTRRIQRSAGCADSSRRP